MSKKPQTYETLQECYDMNKKTYQMQVGLCLGLGLFLVVGLPVIVFICYRDNRNCDRWNASTIW